MCSLVGYSKSWEVCSQLGQSEGFHDLHMRQELMAFALTHCPPNAIEALLGVSSSLQTQVGISETSFMQFSAYQGFKGEFLIFVSLNLSACQPQQVYNLTTHYSTFAVLFQHQVFLNHFHMMAAQVEVQLYLSSVLLMS